MPTSSNSSGKNRKALFFGTAIGPLFGPFDTYPRIREVGQPVKVPWSVVPRGDLGFRDSLGGFRCVSGQAFEGAGPETPDLVVTALTDLPAAFAAAH
jgi:hypothetical protein